MRDLLTANLKNEIELIPGDNGVFEIKLEEDLLYSKKTLGRFPNDGEITKIIAILGKQ